VFIFNNKRFIKESKRTEQLEWRSQDFKFGVAMEPQENYLVCILYHVNIKYISDDTLIYWTKEKLR